LKIIVEDNDIDLGKRLDLYLSLKLPQYSRSLIKKVIESNKVTIQDEVCFKAGYKIRNGDVIDFPEDSDVIPSPSQTLEKSPFDLEILHEDEDYLFINKPSGLIVHPTSAQQKDTLVNKLLSLQNDLPGSHILRPGIVHRLDKDTSGVIVVAKTPKGLWWLSQQFADRKVKKEYISIGLDGDGVSRRRKGETMTFEGFLRRSSRDRKQFAVEKNPASYSQGRFSKSDFEILDTKIIQSNYTLILTKIYPHTGRTHQIRVHQKELGFTIIKDDIYMSKKQLAWSSSFFKTNGVRSRLYLHAFRISFENYDGKRYSVMSPLPEEYIKLFNNATQIT
jgi:23S rRNA pseudouridine1911/1915/1917 synthase